MALECRFNVSKFERVVLVTMTPDMANELRECLDDFEDFDEFPHLRAFRSVIRSICNFKGRSSTRRVEVSPRMLPQQKCDAPPKVVGEDPGSQSYDPRVRGE